MTPNNSHPQCQHAVAVTIRSPRLISQGLDENAADKTRTKRLDAPPPLSSLPDLAPAGLLTPAFDKRHQVAAQHQPIEQLQVSRIIG